MAHFLSLRRELKRHDAQDEHKVSGARATQQARKRHVWKKLYHGISAKSMEFLKLLMCG